MFYYKFNIGDYHSHTSHLTVEEDCAYRRMIDWCYLHERCLPKEIEEIGRLIRMRTHSESIANVLREFFVEREDGFYSDRISFEINEYKTKSDKARASAKARWDKQKVYDDANALRPQCERNANPITHKPINPLTQEKAKRTRFIKPTQKDVSDYSAEKDLNLIGFHDYYESKGWVVGKTKMKDWKAAGRGWSTRQNGYNNEKTYRSKSTASKALDNISDF